MNSQSRIAYFKLLLKEAEDLSSDWGTNDKREAVFNMILDGVGAILAFNHVPEDIQVYEFDDITNDFTDKLIKTIESKIKERKLDSKTNPSIDIMSLLSSLEESSVGLVFIPTVVKVLLKKGLTVKEAHKLLKDLGDEGKIELRPEGGLNRLSKEELELCIPGPQKTHISWARII